MENERKGWKPEEGVPKTLQDELDAMHERSAYSLGYIRQQEEKHKELEERHSFDYLTKLKTREAFESELTTLLNIVRGESPERRERPLKELSLIAVDIDDFKAINDGLGHPAGDEVLKTISAVLSQSVRRGDTVSRVGGEELMILMPDADLGTAVRQAEELRDRIKKTRFPGYDELVVTSSFGVVSSKSSTDPKTLVELADRALYQAKRNGRDRVEIETNL